MKFELYCLCTFSFVLLGPAQDIKAKDPVTSLNEVFSTHQLVLLGDLHGSVQEHGVLLKLIQSRNFSREVNNIVLEGANSLYQPLVDRYLAGENVPLKQLEAVWRNGLAIGPVADEPEIELFEAVRTANRTVAAGGSKLRIVCGEAAVNWDTVYSRDDLQPFVPARDQNYIRIVQEQILAKHQKALLYMGSLHFRRTQRKPAAIEEALQRAGATTYVVLPGTNIVGSYNELDKHFGRWNWPWMLPVQGTWLENVQAKPVVMGGNESNAHISGTLAESTDAFLFLGPRDELKQFVPKRSALERTDYGRETERRLRILFGADRKIPDFPKDDSGVTSQFSPPKGR